MWDIFNSCNIFYSVNIDIAIASSKQSTQVKWLWKADADRPQELKIAWPEIKVKAKINLMCLELKTHTQIESKTACFVSQLWHNSEDIKQVSLISCHLCYLSSWPSQLPYGIILPILAQVWIRRWLLDGIAIISKARNSPKTKIHLMGFGSSPELSGYHCQHWYKGFIFGSFHRLFKSTALPFTARHNHLLISACRAMFRTTDPPWPPSPLSLCHPFIPPSTTNSHWASPRPLSILCPQPLKSGTSYKIRPNTGKQGFRQI